MSFDLPPIPTADWSSPYEHIDPDGDLLPVPADEQPVVLDDEAYEWDRP